MTTTTVYGAAADNTVYCSNGTYATARAGTGTLAIFGASDTNHLLAGQEYFSGDSKYYVYEALMQFDTSVVPDTDFITSAVLTMWPTTKATTSAAFTIQARIYDWGAAVAATLNPDFVAGASLSAETLVATLASGSITTGQANDFTNVALPLNINKTGTTYIQLTTATMASGVYAGGLGTGEYAIFDTQDHGTQSHRPVLTLTHAPLTVGQVEETDLAQPIASPHIVPMAQTTEADTSQAMTVARLYPAGQVSETDTSQAFTVTKQVAALEAMETDSAAVVVPVLTERKPAMYPTAHRLDAFKTQHDLAANTTSHRLAAWPRP